MTQLHWPLLGFIFLLTNLLSAQSGKRIKGPVILDYGSTYEVKQPAYHLDTTKVYRVVFDIADSPEDATKLNPVINTLARYINMHVAAGVPKENIEVVGVFHNRASKDALKPKAYHNRYDVDNPNVELIKQLTELGGAKLFMCGQSIHARGIDREELNEHIGVALSAMTILIDYQAKGYQLISF